MSTKALDLGKQKLLELIGWTYVAKALSLRGGEAQTLTQRIDREVYDEPDNSLNRSSSDVFFEYTNGAVANLDASQYSSSDQRRLDVRTEQALVKTCEADFNLRYNNSRRNSLMACSNNCKRISIDLTNR